MLTTLRVKNIAIIEDLTVDFHAGMSAITGQTGAGKSLVIDAIGLLLGERADSFMIRHGETSALIEGLFKATDATKDWLDSQGIDSRETLSLRREINLNGKNNVIINDTAVTLGQLKQLSHLIADIHIQHQTQRLINPDTYLAFIDQYERHAIDTLYNAYQIELAKYQEHIKNLKKAKTSNLEMNEKLDLLQFQYAELTALNLQDHEIESLNETISKLSNFDQIFNHLKDSYQHLDNDYFTLDTLYRAHQHLSKISHYEHTYDDASKKLVDAYYELEAIREMIKAELESLDFDPLMLEQAQTRLHELERVQKKYGKTIEELIVYREDVGDLIARHDNIDAYLEKLEAKVKAAHATLVIAAKSLSQKRRAIALKLEKALMLECHALDLPKAVFQIAFNDVRCDDPFQTTIYNDDGIDTIDFLVTLNEGEPLKPLSKTASGGELSRIMLAFKSIFAQSQGLSLIVFDEIDAGISGSTASRVAKKIKAISVSTQVLCITHLPQVAALADHHLHIYKEEKEKRTTTHIKTLMGEARISEIAMMLSGERINAHALANAESLLKRDE